MKPVNEVSGSLERDLLNDEKIRTLIQEDKEFATELYSALCNIIWVNKENIEHTMSWRYAGDVVADIAEEGGDYMDFYCSGDEGTVSRRVEKEMRRIGWTWKTYK